MKTSHLTLKPTVSAHAEVPILGALTIVCSDDGLVGVQWGHNALTDSAGESARIHLAQALAELKEYSAGKRRDFSIPIDYYAVRPIEEKVLRLCALICGGTTRTYGELAEEAGVPDGARLVGGVMANNPMPLIIPCHRVVSKDGSLRGYGGPGGIDTKAKLLVFEGARLVA